MSIFKKIEEFFSSKEVTADEAKLKAAISEISKDYDSKLAEVHSHIINFQARLRADAAQGNLIVDTVINGVNEIEQKFASIIHPVPVVQTEVKAETPAADPVPPVVAPPVAPPVSQ